MTDPAAFPLGQRLAAGARHLSGRGVRMVVVAAVVATTGVLGACGHQDAGAPASPTTDAPVFTEPPAGHNAADIAFGDDVLEHHQQLADLAKIASERSQNPDVIAFAHAASEAAQADESTLRVLLLQWRESPEDATGGAAPAEPAPTVSKAAVSALGAIPDDAFDAEWLRAMLNAQSAGVRIATAEITNGANVDAVTVAKRIARTQQAGVDEIQRLLQQEDGV